MGRIGAPWWTTSFHRVLTNFTLRSSQFHAIFSRARPRHAHYLVLIVRNEDSHGNECSARTAAIARKSHETCVGRDMKEREHERNMHTWSVGWSTYLASVGCRHMAPSQ